MGEARRTGPPAVRGPAAAGGLGRGAPPAAAPSAPAAPSVAPAKAAGDDRRAKQLEARAKGQAYAKAFLAKYPQARAMLIEFQTRNMENYYAPFFRAAGLTPAQIDEFIARTAEAIWIRWCSIPMETGATGSPTCRKMTRGPCWGMPGTSSGRTRSA